MNRLTYHTYGAMYMQLQKAELYAGVLMTQYGLSTWKFKWMNTIRTLGRCEYPTKTASGNICLSRRYVELNSETEVVDTILHEIAHAIVGPSHGHDALWRAVATAIGAIPQACASDDSIVSPARYAAMCCGITYRSAGKPKKLYGCNKCSELLQYTKIEHVQS